MEMNPEKRSYLANDICRCHGVGCGIKHSCARYRLIDTGGEGTPVTASLADNGECDEFIEYGEIEK